MLSFSDISRYGFLENVIRQGWICKPGIRYWQISPLCQSIHKPPVFRIKPTGIGGLEPINLLRDVPQVSLGTLYRLLANADAQRLNADVVDVMRLIEDNHTVLVHLRGDDAGHPGVEQVLVAVDDDIGVLDHVPGEEVGAYPALAAERAEVSEGVDPGLNVQGEVAFAGCGVEGLEVVAERGGGFPVVGGLLADLGRGEASAAGVDGAGCRHLWVDAKVLAGG